RIEPKKFRLLLDGETDENIVLRFWKFMRHGGSNLCPRNTRNNAKEKSARFPQPKLFRVYSRISRANSFYSSQSFLPDSIQFHRRFHVAQAVFGDLTKAPFLH